jgi:RNA polymerase sigma-70 factor (ECF subfamily)
MQGQDWLADRFEENRGHLRGVAYRMLGSLNEADDAVQEAWLRLSRSASDQIENLGGWLTTVVSRVCLDMLRSKKARREESMEAQAEPVVAARSGSDPEREATLADSVGLALMVVLDRLSPAERLAFVLHDMFGVSFEEIAGILGKSLMATRQLASRARKRVHGGDALAVAAKGEHRKLVAAVLDALRARDVERLVAALDPEFVFHADEASIQPGGKREIHGAENWARNAVQFAGASRFTSLALVDGDVGLVFAPHGRLMRALKFTFTDGRIIAAEVIGDRERLEMMEFALVE